MNRFEKKSIEYKELSPEDKSFVSNLERVCKNIARDMRQNCEDDKKLIKKLKAGQLSRKDLEWHVYGEKRDDFFEECDIKLEEFQLLMNKWLKVNKKKANMIGEYEIDPWELEAVKIDTESYALNEFLESNGIKVVASSNNYLFLKDVKEISVLENSGFFIPVDVIDTAFVCDNPKGPMKNPEDKIYYKKHGYFSGKLRIEDEPNHFFSVHEMKTFGEFMDKLLSGEYEEALTEMIDGVKQVDSMEDDIDKKDLVMHSKSSDTYRCFEGSGDKASDAHSSRFRLPSWMQGNTEFVKAIGEDEYPFRLQEDHRKYVMEPSKRKDRDTKKKEIEYSKVWINDFDELRLSKPRYQKEFGRTADCFLRAFVGEDHTKALLNPENEIDADYIREIASRVNV